MDPPKIAEEAGGKVKHTYIHTYIHTYTDININSLQKVLGEILPVRMSKAALSNSLG